MKHIPIMLALALSISLSSFDGSTATNSSDINGNQSISSMVATIDADDSITEDGLTERQKNGI